jgi:hypothetical protein
MAFGFGSFILRRYMDRHRPHYGQIYQLGAIEGNLSLDLRHEEIFVKGCPIKYTALLPFLPTVPEKQRMNLRKFTGPLPIKQTAVPLPPPT